MRQVILVLAAIALTLTACGDDDTTAPSTTQITPTTTTKPTAIPAFTFTPTPQVTSPPAVPPAAAYDYRIVTLRPRTDATNAGQLWVARGDGTGAYPITDYNFTASFAGMPSADVLYYVDWTDQLRPELYRVDLTSGAHESILSYDSEHVFSNSAAISPDERYVAYISNGSLDLFDRQTGEIRQLLGNDPSCPPPPTTPNCAYVSPQWSPDGRLIAVGKSYAEGTNIVIVDPVEPADQIIEEVMGHGYSPVWSPDNSRACIQGLHVLPSVLYIADAPDWRTTKHLANLEGPDGRADITVSRCTWLSEDRVVVALSPFNTDAPSALSIVTLSSDEMSQVTEFPPPEHWRRSGVFTMIDSSLLLTSVYSPAARSEPSRPVWIDITTGQTYPLGLAGIAVAVRPIP